MKRFCLALIVVACVALSTASAQWSWTDDFNLSNSSTTEDHGSYSVSRTINNSQQQIAVPQLASYPIHFVWCRLNPDGNQVYYKRLTQSGWSTETLLQPSPLKLHNQFPSFSIATDPTGQKVYVVWHEEKDAQCQIYITHSEDGGISWSTPSRLSPRNVYYYEPAVTVGSDGKVYVVWSNGFMGGTPGIGLAQGFFDGSSWNWNYIEQIDNSINIDSDFSPSIASDPNGSLIHVSWEQQTGDNACKIMYRRFDIATSCLGNLIEIFALPPNSLLNQIDPPHIACSKSGTSEVGIVWADDSEQPGSFMKDVYFIRSTNSGLNWGSKCKISQKESSNYTSVLPVISTSNANSNYIDLLYQEYDPLTSGSEKLFWRRSTDAGNSWSNSLKISVDGDKDWAGHVVTGSNNAGNFIFTSERDGNAEIYYKSYSLPCPSVSITYPVKDGAFCGDTKVNIAWEAVSLAVIDHFDLYFSSDDGHNWQTIATNINAGVREFLWNVPVINSSTARIKVVVTDVGGLNAQDISYWFTIYQPVPNVVISSPTGGSVLMGDTKVSITWGADDEIGLKSFDVFFSQDGGLNWQIVEENLTGDKRACDWHVPFISSSTCKIKIRATNLSGVTGDAVTGNFTIASAILPVNAWQMEYTTPSAVKDIQMIDAENAWAVGDDGLILHQVNGAWNKIVIAGLDKYNLNAIEMKGQYGWIVGEKREEPGKYKGVLMRTTNGGTDWQEITNMPPLPAGTAFKDISFANNDGTGYIACGNGIILKATNNWGVSWAIINDPITEPSGVSGWFNSIYTDPANSARVRVVGDNYGFISESNDGGEK